MRFQPKKSAPKNYGGDLVLGEWVGLPKIPPHPEKRGLMMVWYGVCGMVWCYVVVSCVTLCCCAMVYCAVLRVFC